MASTEWVGIVATIAPKYTKGAIDLTRRGQLWLPLMEKRGRVTFGHVGERLIWSAQYLNQPVTGYSDGQGITYQRHDIYKPMSLDWRGYNGTDLMTEVERLKYSDEVGIVNRYKTTIKTLTNSARKTLGMGIYVDGNAAGHENEFHGLPSFTGAGTCAAADIVAQPSDTYAGCSTAVGQYGSWSTDLTTATQNVGVGYPNSTIATDWPEGYGDVGYDFFSPILSNWSSPNWVDHTTTTWPTNCEAVLRRNVQWLSLNAGMERASLYCFMAGNLFTQFKDHMSTKMHILTPVKEAEELGFPEVLNFEGMGLKAEYGTPAGQFNIFNFEQMELMVLGEEVKELIVPIGPTLDPRTGDYLFRVRVLGNMKYESPKFFGHGQAYA